jgi:Flp pilus assembly protein TadB
MAALLLATAILFVVGVAVERRDEHHAEGTEPASSSEHREASETERKSEEAAHTASGERNEARVLGIDAEATPLVVLAVLVSIMLAVLLWVSDSVGLLAVVALLAAGFAVLDIAEVIHQIHESRTGLAVIALLVAAGHATIAIFGARTSVRRAPAVTG